MKVISIIMATLALTFGVVEAKSYGGGSRSFSSSKNSKSYSSKPKTYSSKTTSQTNKKTVVNKTSAADKARYEKAAKSGKAFTSRDAARADFKKNYASKYPSKYVSEPAKRPEHIPQTYKDPKSGNTYNVTYNQDRGGYGYYSGGGPGLGTFIMYDVMTDMVVMNVLMSKNGYSVGSPPQNNENAVVVACIIAGIVVAGGLFITFIILSN